MRYLLLDIESAAPLPEVALAPDQTGVGTILRERGRPIAFWMEEREAGAGLDASILGRTISARAGKELLAARIREELHVETDPLGPFPGVTIAICTKDGAPLVARCLESIEHLRFPDGVPRSALEVLVIDNASSDDQVRKAVAQHREVRYVREARPGLDFARNRAMVEAQRDLLAFIDDDVVLDPSWLEGLHTAWQRHPDAAAFTGLVLPFELETEAQILFEANGGFRRGFDSIRYHGPDLVDNPWYPCGAGIFGAGANMAFRRNALDALGGFDPALDTGAPLPGGGDLDIFYRIIRAGEPLVYEPRMVAFHQHRQTIPALRRQYRSWGLGFMAFVEKSFRSDRSMRYRFFRVVVWWFRYQVRQFLRSLRGNDPQGLPPRMILEELAGGLIGIVGEYRRSRRRVSPYLGEAYGKL